VTTPCNVRGKGVAAVGEFVECVSASGAHDMSGNAAEWVADWATSSANNTGDISALPVGVARGGDAGDGAFATVNYYGTNFAPSSTGLLRGFRCAR
jgi:formylglycine-generating enzyme required for sulfatase activity